MQRVTPTLTKLESSSAAFRHPRPEPREPLSPYSVNVLTSLRRHPFLALFVTVAVFALGYAYLYLRYGRSYYAESIVYVAPTYPEILPQPLGVAHMETPYDPLNEEQVNTVTRHDILIRAIHQLPAAYFPYGSDQDKANALAAQLSVDRVPNTYQIKISMHDTDPNRVTDIVNRVTQSYIETAQKEEYFGRDQAVAALQKERDGLVKEMADHQDEKTRLEHTLGIATFNPSLANPFNERLTKLNTDLVDARDRLHAAQSEFEAVQSDNQTANNSSMRAEAADLVANDSGLNALKLSLAQRRSQLVSAMAGMTEANPARRQDEIELADIDRTLARMTSDATSEAVQRLEDRYRTNLLRSRDYEARVSHDLAVAEADAAVAAPRFQRIEDLNSTITHDADRIHSLEDRIVSLNIESNVPGSVHIFSPAVRPTETEGHKSNILLLLLIPVSLGAGLLAVAARDAFDETVYSPSDVERTVGLPPVGILFDRSEVSDAVENEFVFRLAATLDHARVTANVRSFALTSVGPGQGTSTIVRLLAQELCQIGNRVLIIDAVDHKDPVVLIPPEQDDPNANPNPRLMHPELGLAVGSRGRNLPSIATVADIFRRNYGDYDILLLDCAPLLLSAEVEYQVRQADATLLIAEAGSTRKPDLLRAARLLDRLRVPGLAIVLNRLRLDRAGVLRSDIKAFERHGRRLPNYYPEGRSPFIDGSSFHTSQVRPDGPAIEDPQPRRNRVTYDYDAPVHIPPPHKTWPPEDPAPEPGQPHSQSYDQPDDESYDSGHYNEAPYHLREHPEDPRPDDQPE